MTVVRFLFDRVLLAVVASAVLALPTSAQTTYSWDSSVSGNFTTASNWTPSGVPGSGDDALINSQNTSASGAFTVTVSSAVQLGSGSLSLYTDRGTFSPTLNVESGGSLGTVQLSSQSEIGAGSTAITIAAGGALTATNIDLANTTLTVNGQTSRLVNGPIDHIITGDGAVIQGTGVIAGNVIALAGTNLRAGTGTTTGTTLTAETLRFDNLDSSLSVGIGGTSSSSNLHLTGSSPLGVHLGGSGQLILNLTNDGISNTLGTYSVITTDSAISGVTADNFVINLLGFTSSTTPFVTVNSNSVTVTLTPVPEPTTTVLVGTAGLGLFGWLRRRRTV
jgi:hypothetical protein